MNPAQGVNQPNNGNLATQLAHDLRKLAQVHDLSDEERQSLQDASSMLIRQAATIALVKHAMKE